MVVLNAGGALLSVIGVIIAVKRVVKIVKPRMTQMKSAQSV
jgi:hypothetical protein